MKVLNTNELKNSLNGKYIFCYACCTTFLKCHYVPQRSHFLWFFPLPQLKLCAEGWGCGPTNSLSIHNCMQDKILLWTKREISLYLGYRSSVCTRTQNNSGLNQMESQFSHILPGVGV